MTLGEALRRGGEILAAGNIAEPQLESEILLRHVLGIDRAKLFLESDSEIDPGKYEEFRRCIEQRLSGKPSAYITGHREFYGLDFRVTPDVLIPRPETELLVERAIECARKLPSPVIADIGTGCGAIAVSLAVNLPQAKIYAVDISPAALEIARSNSEKHGVSDRVEFLEGDLLEPLPGQVDIIAANLPYVRKREMPEVNTAGYEPALALDGGEDGLDEIRRLGGQAREKLRSGGCLLMEIGQGQSEELTAFLSGLFPEAEIEVFPDLAGIDRVASVVLPA